MTSQGPTVALATLVVLAAGAAGVGAVAGADGATATPAPSATPVPQVDADPDVGTAAFVGCTNGTSRAAVACGYDPGPTAVSLTDQRTTGASVRVAAVNLSEGGFVAVHRLSFVDGAVTESLVGVSGYLDAGLHRDVAVDATAADLDGAGTLVAVAYRDDGDRTFEFVATDGATDRPYTNSYAPSTGNVTDEAGDVIGDLGAVTVVDDVRVVGDAPARDPDGDGRYEDVDGDGDVDVLDVVGLLSVDRAALDADGATRTAVDFDGDGDVDFLDVVSLLTRL